MITAAAPLHVTPHPWPRTLDRYGALDTYLLAAHWLHGCAFVADWGGASGFFGSCLPTATHYTVVDGTAQPLPLRAGPGGSRRVLADLRDYTEPSDGILLRHVLDNTSHWQPILRNALAAFRQRMVVVTFTPDAAVTRRTDHANDWPTWVFNPKDLRRAMGASLVRDEVVQTSHPERIYYLERRAA